MRRHTELDDELISVGGVDPYVALERGDLLDAIDRAAIGLPSPAREVVELYYAEGLCARRIGIRIGVGENTVRSRVVRATARLQSAMRDWMDPDARRQAAGIRSPCA